MTHAATVLEARDIGQHALEGIDVERHKFRQAQAGGLKKFEHRAIAGRGRRILVIGRQRQQAGGFID